jgi:tripartite-type tricarboxylate transporter receptor subunit TctC
MRITDNSGANPMRANAITGALSVVAAALAMIANPIPASAQDWPARAVTLVVPFAAAGGGTDVMARIIAGPMAEILGQDVIVENITGAGGMVGSAHVARAAPDGYTILFGSRSAAIDMTLYKHPSYNLQNDLSPIVLVADQPTILVARKDLPVDGLREFMIHLKHNAGTMRMRSAGVGATGFVDCAIFNGRVGVRVQAIPYRGSGPAMQDLIGGQFDYFCTISGSAAGPPLPDIALHPRPLTFRSNQSGSDAMLAKPTHEPQKRLSFLASFCQNVGS